MTDKEARRILIDIADQMPSDVCADWIDAISVGVKAIDAQSMRDATEEERKSVKDYIESISKPTEVRFDTQLTDAKETIIKSALKYLVKMQIEEGSVGFAVDNDPDHDCCWDELLTWLEAQPCRDCITRESVIEWLKDKDIIKTKNQEENARRELGELPSVTPTSEDIKEAYIKGYDYGVKDWFKSKTQPCEDCVSREQALLALTGMDLPTDRDKLIAFFTERIQQLPSVTPQRPKGKWIIVDDCEHFIAKCSECGEIVDSRMINNYPYCHCGAEMNC